MTYRKLQSAHARKKGHNAKSLTTLIALTGPSEIIHDWRATHPRVPRACKPVANWNGNCIVFCVGQGLAERGNTGPADLQSQPSLILTHW